MIATRKVSILWDAGEFYRAAVFLHTSSSWQSILYPIRAVFCIWLWLTSCCNKLFIFIVFCICCFVYLSDNGSYFQCLKNKYFIASGGAIAALLTAFSYTFWMNQSKQRLFRSCFCNKFVSMANFCLGKEAERLFASEYIIMIIYVLF